MKKHLHILLALVAFVGLVNGLGGGASGSAGGEASKSGGLGATAPKNISAVSLNAKGGSATSGNRSTPGGTTSVLGGGAGGGTGGDTSRTRSGSTGGAAGGSVSGGTRANVGGSASGGPSQATARQTSGTGRSVTAGADSRSGGSNPAQGPAPSSGRDRGGGGARATAAGGSSEAPSDGSSGSPGSSAPASRNSSRVSGGAEDLSRGPVVGRSVGSGNRGRSNPRGGNLELGPFASGSSREGGSPVRGFGFSMGGAGGGLGASVGESGRLDSGLFSDGQSFGDRERGTLRFGAFGGGSSGYSGSPFSDFSIGGVDGAAGGSAGGRPRLGDEGLFGEETDVSSAFGASGPDVNRGTGFPSSGISSRESGFGEDFGAGSFGRGWNRGSGGFGGSALGFGDFSSGSNTDFGGNGGGFGFPEGSDGGPGPSGGSSDGENGPLPGLFAQQGPGSFPGSDNGPDGSARWPSPRSFNDFESSGLDGSRSLDNPVANVPRGSQRPRLLQRLWQRRHRARGLSSLVNRVRKPDPRTTSGLFLGSLAAAAGIGGLRARIAAALQEGREQGKFGPRRRFCFGRCRARQRRLHAGMKVAEDILNRIPGSLQRLY